MGSEKRSGPLFTETIVLLSGLMANPNGPGPVMYWRPVGATMRPPGRMLGDPGRRIAGLEPAGALYSAVRTEVQTAIRQNKRRMPL